MKHLSVRDYLIKPGEYSKDLEIEKVSALDTLFVLPCAFMGCKNLTDVYFSLDITRISNGAFEDCASLKDVWFAITDEDKIIEIADDAFRGCKDITFHIFGSAIKNKYLNNYAKKHDFKVVSMI